MKPRPQTLQEVAAQTESLADFGRLLRDWLHELRRVSSRAGAGAAIAGEPRRLAGAFAGGAVADAWLGAYAEHPAGRIGRPAPEWAFAPGRIATEPVFDEGGDSPVLRALALARAPLAFKRRNIFTPSVDLPLALRAGRPRTTAEDKRQVNAERQRRFREVRKAELVALREGKAQETGDRSQATGGRAEAGARRQTTVDRGQAGDSIRPDQTLLGESAVEG